MLPYPFTIVLGGKPDLAKVRQIGALLDKADVLIVGGAIGNAMLKASGGRVGTSMTSEELEEGAAFLTEKVKERGIRCFLPIDLYAASQLSERVRPSLEGSKALFDDKAGYDIGPRSVEYFRNVILMAGSLLITGPMGYTEISHYKSGTRSILTSAAKSAAQIYVAGQDTLAALDDNLAANERIHVYENLNAFMEDIEV